MAASSSTRWRCITEVVAALVMESVAKSRDLRSRGGEADTPISSSELSTSLAGMTIWRVPLARVPLELVYVGLTPWVTDRWLRADPEAAAAACSLAGMVSFMGAGRTSPSGLEGSPGCPSVPRGSQTIGLPSGPLARAHCGGNLVVTVAHKLFPPISDVHPGASSRWVAHPHSSRWVVSARLSSKPGSHNPCGPCWESTEDLEGN